MLMKGTANTTFIFPDGSVGTADANGYLTVAAAFVSAALLAGFLPILPQTLTVTADAGSTATLTAAQVTGAGRVILVSSGGSTPTLTTPTAAQIYAAGNIPVGDSYVLRICNANSGTLTVAAGTNVTLPAVVTTATNTWIEYKVTITSATAVAFTYLGKGVY